MLEYTTCLRTANSGSKHTLPRSKTEGNAVLSVPRKYDTSEEGALDLGLEMAAMATQDAYLTASMK